jgi:hypothetical protein
MTSERKTTPCKKVSARKTWKKPKGKPKRPLSAYNFFFQYERNRLVSQALQNAKNSISPKELEQALKSGRNRPHRKTHGKISFKELTSIVSHRWKSLSLQQRAPFEAKANLDTKRYQLALHAWNQAIFKQRAQVETRVSSSSQATPETSQTFKIDQEDEESRSCSSDVSFEPFPLNGTSRASPSQVKSQAQAFQDEAKPNQTVNCLSASHLTSLLSGLAELSSKLEPECHEMMDELRFL